MTRPSPLASASTWTDANGTYATAPVPVTPSGVVHVKVAPPAHSPGDAVGRVLVVPAAAGAVRVDVDLAAVKLTGIVTADGEPLPGARVEVTDADTGAALGSATTGAGGTYAIDRLPAGEEVVVRAVGPGGLTASRTLVAGSRSVLGLEIGTTVDPLSSP